MKPKLSVGFESPHVRAACMDALPGWVPVVGAEPPFAFGGVAALCPDLATAVRVAERWNAHDQLVAALRDLCEALDCAWPTDRRAALINERTVAAREVLKALSPKEEK